MWESGIPQHDCYLSCVSVWTFCNRMLDGYGSTITLTVQKMYTRVEMFYLWNVWSTYCTVMQWNSKIYFFMFWYYSLKHESSIWSNSSKMCWINLYTLDSNIRKSGHVTFRVLLSKSSILVMILFNIITYKVRKVLVAFHKLYSSSHTRPLNRL